MARPTDLSRLRKLQKQNKEPSQLEFSLMERLIRRGIITDTGRKRPTRKAKGRPIGKGKRKSHTSTNSNKKVNLTKTRRRNFSPPERLQYSAYEKKFLLDKAVLLGESNEGELHELIKENLFPQVKDFLLTKYAQVRRKPKIMEFNVGYMLQMGFDGKLFKESGFLQTRILVQNGRYSRKEAATQIDDSFYSPIDEDNISSAIDKLFKGYLQRQKLISLRFKGLIVEIIK